MKIGATRGLFQNWPPSVGGIDWSRIQRPIQLCLLFLTVMIFGKVAWAQVDTGAVLGTVKDSSGAVVPGTKVTLTNEGTGLSDNKAAGPDGAYIFTPVKIGSYTVTAEFQGFKKEIRPHIVVNVQDHVVVDFTLVPGATTQSIEVTAAAPLLQTADASVGQLVGARQINDLPLNGRNYVFLAQLSAGVTFAQQDNIPGQGDSAYNSFGAFSANGVISEQNNFMLNGVDNNNTQPDAQSGWWFAVLPPIDALDEFKVQTLDYSAEMGRAAGAVLNVVVKSGTNKLHGDLWEFVRNDKLDAADFFENSSGTTKGEFRQNQFGGTLGGPLHVPVLWGANNKAFFFLSYEGTRIRHASPETASVPTALERSSGYTNFSDLITQGVGGTSPADDLGRTFTIGQIFDPATTRPVTQGVVDPVTDLVATQTGYVREPFTGNLIPSNRIDPNAVRLLNLYSAPTTTGLFNNFFSDVPAQDNANDGVARIDENIGKRDQLFATVTYDHSPSFLPSLFPGPGDGAIAYNAGTYGITATNSVLGETHSFSPTTVNEFRIAFVRHANLNSDPENGVLGLPQQFGIQGIPQSKENGGLPAINISGLNQLGAATFTPLEKISNVWDLRENLTKVHGAHSMKAGFEGMLNYVPYIVAQKSRGVFTYTGAYTSIPTADVGDTAIAQFVLTPTAATVPGGIDNVGGMNSLAGTGIINSTYTRNYLAGYLQDDYRVSSKLTVNLGLRWEFVSPTRGLFQQQADFVPGTPFSTAEYLYPKSNTELPPATFLAALQEDGVAFTPTNNVSGINPKHDFAPRIGIAYRLGQNLILRAGYGVFFGGLENIGALAYMGATNEPYLIGLSYPAPNSAEPITPDNSIGGLENGLSNISLTPSSVTATTGFNVAGYQFRPNTPYTQGANVMVQYELTPNQSVQVGYVGTFGRHLYLPQSLDNVTEMLPPLLNPLSYVPFPDFSEGASYVTYNGSSYYDSLQISYNRRISKGLTALANYTWSKCRSDALSFDSPSAQINGYRATDIPGFGIEGDYGPCEADVRQIVHAAFGYDLPFGKGKKFLTNPGRVANFVAADWSVHGILSLQDGQPFTIYCDIGTAAGVGCDALLVPGQNINAGPHNANQWLNPAVFTNPALATTIGQSNLAPLGGAPAQAIGPGFHRLDFSLFKQFQTSESTHIEFRAEVFNLTNTPNMSIPFSQLDFELPQFSQITQTRDTPNDPREIQLALKFYW
jgi:hypothetical protein